MNLLRLAEAVALYEDALQFVGDKIDPITNPPSLTFCSSAECSRSFGFTFQGAYTVGTVGIVIGPRGWKPYFVRHELIHHLQLERIGALRVWLFKPTWFVEGMAYSLSEDPRRPLPEPLEGYRAKFERWFVKVGKGQVWREAAKL